MQFWNKILEPHMYKVFIFHFKIWLLKTITAQIQVIDKCAPTGIQSSFHSIKVMV